MQRWRRPCATAPTWTSRRRCLPAAAAGPFECAGTPSAKRPAAMAGKGIKSSSNLQARIKKMMQSDEDVGKVAKAAPVLIGAPGWGAASCVRQSDCALQCMSQHFGLKLRGAGDSRSICTVHPSPEPFSPWAPPPHLPRLPAAKALDVFLLQLVQGAADIAQRRGAKMLTASHMWAVARGNSGCALVGGRACRQRDGRCMPRPSHRPTSLSRCYRHPLPDRAARRT